MSLALGARLGPYEVLAPVGVGGMGEVYKARDPRLGRDVAVKVLPAAFSADPERLHRFEQEARAAAALNHPNILAVYDLGQHDGAPYIVSELLEGETLRERLTSGALPVRKAVEYAVQIAHGLAAAHEKGITHRDLKPENVFVTTDGRVKILDFGLAKLTQAEPGAVALSALPTTPPNTLPGVVLGTIGYMAPEQVRGQTADHRSDIFAFGAILYEMLSGQRAFRGETHADTMSAILAKDPPDLSTDERHISPALARIVDRCLEKSPNTRFQTTSDLAFALEGLSAHSDKGVPSPILAGRKRSNAWLAWALAFVVALAITGMVLLRPQSGPPRAAARAGPPVIVLMDSPHPERVYDPDTRKTGGTNADDLTDLLRDLPVVLLKENTSAAWHREREVVQESPALIVAHRSSFYDTTLFDPTKYGDVGHTQQFAALAQDKFDAFMGYVGETNPQTRFVVYSRGSWRDEPARVQWIATIEQRFPVLRGRVDAMRVPLDRATFRNPITGAEIKRRIENMLQIEAPKS